MVNQTPNTLDDLNFDQFIKTANYEETVRQLDIYYGTGMHLLSFYKPYLSTTTIFIKRVIFCHCFCLVFLKSNSENSSNKISL